MYCHRFRTPHIYQTLKELENIKKLNTVEDFVLPRKKKDPEYLKKLKALHQSPGIELKHIAFLLRKERKLDTITDKSRPQRPSKHDRKAIKSEAAVAASS